MIFIDYPEIKQEDYKIPNWIDPEFMMTLWKNTIDRKIHDYLILAWTQKFTSKQINRILYLNKYSAYRLRLKIKLKLEEYQKIKKGGENVVI
jgi:hypothetical protein